MACPCGHRPDECAALMSETGKSWATSEQGPEPHIAGEYATAYVGRFPRSLSPGICAARFNRGAGLWLAC